MCSVKAIKAAKTGYILMSALLCILGIMLIAAPEFFAPLIAKICGILYQYPAVCGSLCDGRNDYIPHGRGGYSTAAGPKGDCDCPGESGRLLADMAGTGE